MFGAVTRADKDLAEARRVLASLLQSISGLFYRCELRSPWKFSFLSGNVEELTGYSAEHFEKGTGWSEIVHPADHAAVAAAISEASDARRSFEITYRIIRKDGSTAWVAERGQAVFDQSDSALFLEGVISDVSGREQADELQRTMVTKWRTTLDTIPQMVWTMAADGSDEFYNRRWFEFTGLKVGGAEGVQRLELVHPDDRLSAHQAWLNSYEAQSDYEAQYRLRHHSGEYRWVLSRGCLEKDVNGGARRWYGTCTDVHEQVLGKAALQASETLNRSIVAASPDCISLLDSDGKVIFMNEAARIAVGAVSAEVLIGAQWGELFPNSARAPANVAIKNAIKGRKGHFSASQQVDGTRKWWDVVVAPTKGNEGEVAGIITIARDMTQQKAAEERVRWAAHHDPLTSLPNRTLFQRSIDDELKSAAALDGTCTILMMDLDDFKRTNDALGHDAGDALLAEFAKRVKESVRPNDLVARLGGDEFALLLRGVGHEERVEAAVKRILSRLEVPFTYDGRLLDIRCTIGASNYPRDGSTRIELLKHADIALYVAKANSRGGLVHFRSNMRAEVQRRLSMLSVAKQAIREDRILPYYQPKFNLRTGSLDGFEALLRWKHTNERLQKPSTIEAAFKDVSLAAEISDKIVEAVVHDVHIWNEEGVAFRQVAINAGAAELRKEKFADHLLERLQQANVGPSCIQIEVTESVFLGRGAELVEKTLKALACEGIQIALDDFGTGYASLTHLNHFPVHALKIDRSFVGKLERSPHDAAIVRAIVNLGRSLGITIVAEGIENNGQLAFLRKHRCDIGQGYLFARAECASKVPELVKGWSNGHPVF